MLARVAASVKARPDVSRRRILIVSLSLVAWMLAIGVRLVYLQTSQHEWLKTRARLQQQDAIASGSLRGLMLDRQGRELARSIDTESFYVIPGEIKNIHELVAQVAPIIEAGQKEQAALVARFAEAQQKKRKFAWLARKLEHAQAERIRALKLEGVASIKEPKRYYPNGQLAAHILGFVGLDENGLSGIEQSYNQRISGEAGKILVETDAHRQPYSSLELSPQPGQSVVLTIDQMMQYRAEQALMAAVTRSRARSGTAIVLDPRTGEILALANAPTFDPNDAHAVDANLRRNDALQNIYEPGSTFKIVAYSAAIEEKLARPEDRIDCQMGSITVAGRRINDHHPYGTLTLIDALAKSSNVAAIKLGLRVGNPRMYDYIRRFGFGSRTGVELPGETVGLLRPVARWQPSSIGSIAIGQEIGVTPLQVAAAFATLANHGVRIAPHLVREIRGADGSIVSRAEPEQRHVVSAQTAQALRGMLESVTLKGTAKRAQLNGYTAAGKTGTAQKIDPKTRAYSKTKHVASFVGFAPVENPAVVIIVVIDEPVGAYHGGEVAAPVFREIAEQILPDLNIAPDTELLSEPTHNLLAQTTHQAEASAKVREELQREEEERQATLPRVAVSTDQRAGLSEIVYAPATQRAVLMPDLRGRSVRDAARICAQLGVQLEARGEGRALRQSPAVGTELDAGQVVRIDFARTD